jgi:endonuclease/exonuclease/phosphatase family metal-dependent hydrolase
VVNLHLQADDPPDAPLIYGAARAAQIRAVLDHLEARPRLPTIVCGDLNVPEGSEEYRTVLLPKMRELGYTEVAEGLELQTYSPTKNPIVSRFDPFAFDTRVDYIWTRGDDARRFTVTAGPTLLLSEPIEGEIFPSDHFGIGVELTLT